VITRRAIPPDAEENIMSGKTSRHSKKSLSVAAVCWMAALASQTTLAAGCPPGYHGTYPRCVPEQAKPRHVHATTPKMRRWHAPAPSPSPVEHVAHASNRRAIIFVGGKQALNPQPIPPGHAARALPRHSAPAEKPIRH
jgi:hypothetical protein